MVVVRAYTQTLLFSCRQSCCTQQFQYFTALLLIRLCIGVEYEPVCQQHRHEWARGLKRHAFQACLPDRANFGTLQSVCRMAR
jgi:hypothetical protein